MGHLRAAWVVATRKQSRAEAATGAAPGGLSVASGTLRHMSSLPNPGEPTPAADQAMALSPHEVLALAFGEHNFTQDRDGAELFVQTTEPSTLDDAAYIDVTVINWANDTSVSYRYRIQHEPE